MLTALIRSSTILGFLLTYLLAPGLFVAAWFLRSDSFAQNDLLFAHWAFGWLQERTGLIPIICILLASVGSIVSRLRMREVRNILGNSNLTMLAYASLLASQPKLLFFRPDILLAALLILGLFMLLLSTYKQENALSEMFHVGLLLGSASLVVGQSILLLLTVAFSLIVLRTGNWREWVVFLLGIAMTAVFVLMVTIWNENPITSFQTVVQTAWVGSFSVDKPSAGHAALFFLIVLSAGSVLKDVTVGTVSERNITMTKVGWAFGIALMVAVLGLGWQAGLILAAFPLSSFIANGIERNSRWWLQDLLLILLIAAPFLSSLWLF